MCVSVVSCRPTVKLLSPEDGKQRIVQAAQQLCRSVEKKAMSSKDINVSMLDIILRGTEDRCDCEGDIFVQKESEANSEV